MFVGYLRNDYEDNLEELINSNILFESELLKQTYKAFPQYCFAAYEDEKIVAVLSAYFFKKSLYINVIEALESYEEFLPRLIDLLLKNSSNKDLFFLLKESLKNNIDQEKFKEHSSFVKYFYQGEPVAFNFSNSMAKQVNGENYDEVTKLIDKQVFDEQRDQYVLHDAVFSNSLKLSTNAGMLHSYVVNKKYIRISPWLMKNEASIDAEKLLRGVLYYRGLKKIFAYAPKDVEEISNLYKSYKFKQQEEYALFYFGQKPKIKLENLYAL